MHKFSEVTAGSSHFTRRHVIILSHFFAVSREAMVRRLEELNLIKQGTWDWFLDNGGITDEQAIQVVGPMYNNHPSNLDIDSPVSLRLGLLAEEVYRKGLMSEGQLANLLDVDRIDLREILDTGTEERSDSDVGVELY